MTIAFYLLGALVLFCGLNVVLRRNPVHAALWLVAGSLAQAGVFVTLGADLLAAVQVLVHAGAVVVLFLFVVMTVGSAGDRRRFGGQAPLGAAVALAVAVLLAAAARAADLRMLNVLGPSSAAEIGRWLLGTHALAFEAASLLLLAALVAAVVASRSDA